MGVFPVAISTIIVSPTARPRPSMIAAKIPPDAAGNTTRRTVCQRDAPKASDADDKESGTLEMASSETVKMIGITANPRAKPTTRLLRVS